MEYLIPFKSTEKTPERDENLRLCKNRLEHYGEKYSVITNSEPFNRAKLLNKGISQSDDPFFFCLDADIIVPDGFTELVKDVLKHYDIFFPICYSLYKNSHKGWWRHSGLGLVGCSRKIWDEFGLKWNEERTTWGGEDNDL